MSTRFAGARRLIPFALILLVHAAIYLPSLDNELVWDDRCLLVDSVGSSNIDSIGRALTTPYLEMIHIVTAAPPFYRPFSMALLMVERQLFGTNPLGYRMVHSTIHLINALLVFGLATLLARDHGVSRPDARRAATIASLVFLALPYTVEAVCFLTDLGDLLALAALLTSVIITRSFMKFPRPGLLVALFVTMAVGVASKETAAAIPAVLLLFGLQFGEERKKGSIILVLVCGTLPVLAFLLVRIPVVESSLELTPLSIVRRFPYDLMVALRSSLAPYPGAIERPLPEAPGVILTILGGIVMLGGGAAIWKLRRREPVTVLSAAAWFLTLTPSMTALHMLLVFPVRYLYVPAAWLAIATGRLFFTRRRLNPIAAGGVVLALGLLAAIRVQAWSDELSLWSAETEVYPERAYNAAMLAKALGDDGQLPQAAAIYRHIIETTDPRLDPRSVSFAHQELGQFLSKQGRLDEALANFERALHYDRSRIVSWLRLGDLHGRDGSWEKALACFGEALELREDHFEAIIMHAGALAALGRYDAAMADLDRAGSIASGSVEKTAEVTRRRQVIERLKADREAAAESEAR